MKTIAFSLAAGFLLILGTVAVTGAHQGSVNPDVIHGCFKNGNGAVFIVDSSEECSGSQTAIHWNAEGPTGPAGNDGIDGADGVDGTDGATGAQGPPGLSGYEIVRKSVPATGTTLSARKDVTVECPAGKKVLGGGGEPAGTTPTTWALIQSSPVIDGLGNKWAVIAVNSNLNDPWKLDGFAVCAIVAP